MAYPNLFLLSILIVILTIFCCNVNCRRIPQQSRPTRGFKEMELAVARSFGKRDVNMDMVNHLLMEWIAYETKMRNLRMPNQYQNNDYIIPE